MKRLAVLLCAVALGALAEEPAPPVAEDTSAKPAAPASAAPASGEQRAQARAAATPAVKSPERFDPSEQISEDLSVSFPADI